MIPPIARIGWLYSLQKDFSLAIDFTNQAVDMIHRHLSNPNINESHLIKYYNNLRIFYDSTAQENRMIETRDSCIGVAVRLQTGFERERSEADSAVGGERRAVFGDDESGECECAGVAVGF